MVVASLKCLLTSGAKASNSSTERQTFSERIRPMTSNALTFDSMGAMYLNWGAGSTNTGVLRSGLAEEPESLVPNKSFRPKVHPSAELVLKLGGLVFS